MNPDPTLVQLIYAASAQAFADWRVAHPNEKVFAFALSTLDDAIYVNASLNSEESHQRTLAERRLDRTSPEALDAKWGPWEWENEYIGPSHFSVVDDYLKGMYNRMHEDSFAEFRLTVFDSMLQALSKLKQDRVITNCGDSAGITFFATIYDSFQAESLHRRSAELLNSPQAAEELLSVIGG